MQFLVRPFERIIQGGPSDLESQLVGTIEDDSFVFAVNGARFPVPALRCGEDLHGPFAVVQESEREVNLGFHLRVEIEPDEDHPEGPFGCSISLIKPNPHIAEMQAANPRANVIMLVDSSTAVYFGPTGHCNGYGGGATNWSDLFAG